MTTLGEVCVLICNVSDLDLSLMGFSSVDRITCVFNFLFKH